MGEIATVSGSSVSHPRVVEWRLFHHACAFTVTVSVGRWGGGNSTTVT